MENNRKKLHLLCKIFLKEDNDYPELTKAINDLDLLFHSASKLEAGRGECIKDIFLPSGKAIGTHWAAMCVKEIMRTKNFIRGIYKGIKSAKERFPGERIHILYAGTGPFATLAIPLTTLFSPEEISFTLLEINPESIKLLRNVIEAFQAEAYITEIVQCDAAVYKHDRSEPIHMIISETMQNALQKEPQVAITMNLLPQLMENGILIPQNIKIEAAVLNQKKNMDRMTGASDYDGKCYHLLGTVFELNKNTRYGDSFSFPEVAVDIPQDLGPGYKELCLLTTIQVFEDVYLNHWQCSLNLPKKIMLLDPQNTQISRTGFQYVINNTPGFVFRILSGHCS